MSSRGAILFAFNSKYNYYAIAEYTARRINHFLNLPVTVVTDAKSITSSTGYNFDKVITVDSDSTNIRGQYVWINKGRYQAYELSPYDETLLLDVDYMVNSDRLLKCFDVYDDFCCHEDTAFYMHPSDIQEVLSYYGHKVLWATAVAFKKSRRAEQIFGCLKMIQDNYEYYGGMHNFNTNTYRNDYALTLALRMVNGHMLTDKDIIPWNLLHLGRNTIAFANNNSEFNTEYTMVVEKAKGDIKKTEYITVKDTDFHTMNKQNFAELIKNG